MVDHIRNIDNFSEGTDGDVNLRNLRTELAQLEGRIAFYQECSVAMLQRGDASYFDLTRTLEDLRTSRDATLAEINAIPR